jgi:hypothetical protein
MSLQNVNTAMQTDYVQGSAQYADNTSIEPGAAHSVSTSVFFRPWSRSDIDSDPATCAAMSIKLCKNGPPVTIFGNVCVIWALLRKVELFLTEVVRMAEFIVTSLRTQPHTERRRAACRLWIRYLETDESKQTSSGGAAQGVQSGAAKQGTNSSVPRSVCERLTIILLFFLSAADVVWFSIVSWTLLRMYSKVSILKY